MFGVPKGVGLGALQEAEAELCRAQEYLLDWKESEQRWELVVVLQECAH